MMEVWTLARGRAQRRYRYKQRFLGMMKGTALTISVQKGHYHRSNRAWVGRLHEPQVVDLFFHVPPSGFNYILQ